MASVRFSGTFRKTPGFYEKWPQISKVSENLPEIVVKFRQKFPKIARDLRKMAVK